MNGFTDLCVYHKDSYCTND